jgi:hypothetical protein
MAANTNPIFSLTPQVSAVAVTAACTKSDGAGTIGTDIFKAFTAGSDGSWVSRLRITPFASVAATATTATVARVFVSSATSGAVTSATCFLIGEVSLPSVTADHSTTAINPVEIPLNFALKASWTILVTTHAVPAANTGQMFTVFAGDY